MHIHMHNAYALAPSKLIYRPTVTAMTINRWCENQRSRMCM